MNGCRKKSALALFLALILQLSLLCPSAAAAVNGWNTYSLLKMSPSLIPNDTGWTLQFNRTLQEKEYFIYYVLTSGGETYLPDGITSSYVESIKGWMEDHQDDRGSVRIPRSSIEEGYDATRSGQVQLTEMNRISYVDDLVCVVVMHIRPIADTEEYVDVLGAYLEYGLREYPIGNPADIPVMPEPDPQLPTESTGPSTSVGTGSSSAGAFQLKKALAVARGAAELLLRHTPCQNLPIHRYSGRVLDSKYRAVTHQELVFKYQDFVMGRVYTDEIGHFQIYLPDWEYTIEGGGAVLAQGRPATGQTLYWLEGKFVTYEDVGSLDNSKNKKAAKK